MELNREQIIKALECCTYGGDKTKSQVEVCSPCPYFYEGNCTQVLKEHALALIKELTDENERIKADTIRNIKTHVHNKAIYPDGTREHGYITLKAFDSVIAEMLEHKK